ncbi:hypothetical protein [Vibrio fortis]|uniref:hypothetical protein n=1 Tax=Vibrio fortis TaxID=212667 RepID=UPI0036F272D5
MGINDKTLGLTVTTNMTSAGFRDVHDFSFELLLEQGTSGEKGTDNFVNHFKQLEKFNAYLNKDTENRFQRNDSDTSWSRNATHDECFLEIRLETPDPSDKGQVAGQVALGLGGDNPTLKVGQLSIQVGGLANLAQKAGKDADLAVNQVMAHLADILTAFVVKTLGETYGIAEESSDGSVGHKIQKAVEKAGDKFFEHEFTKDINGIAEVMEVDMGIDAAGWIPVIGEVISVIQTIRAIIKFLSKKQAIRVMVFNETDKDWVCTVVPKYNIDNVMGEAKQVSIQATSTLTPLESNEAVKMYGCYDVSFSNNSGLKGVGFVIDVNDGQGGGGGIAISIPYTGDNKVLILERKGVLDDNPYPDYWDFDRIHGPDLHTYDDRFGISLGLDAKTGHDHGYHVIARILPNKND